MRGRLLILIHFVCLFPAYAQQLKSIKMKDPVICYANPQDHPYEIAPPEEYLLWKNNPQARVKTANIEVTYVGFSPQAQQAFQAAVDIWESIISSPVTIRVEAHWSVLDEGALGGAIYTSAYANFAGAQKLDVFYPVALAEKILGQNLNGDQPDIFAQFSSTANWHLNPNPGSAIPSQHFDLVTVVLHEIGHGLGFASTFNGQGTTGTVGLNTTGVPVIYDVPIENGSGSNLIESFTSPSADLKTQLTSSNLFFNSHASSNSKIYAPFTFNPGSSISHLDDNTFDGTPNALMTHAVAPQERMHSPGVALNILEDLGWEITKINHHQFPGSEDQNGPYTITATIQADNGYNASSVKLHHTLNGVNFTVVSMTATGTPNQFTANIPGTGNPGQYGYFISAEDNTGRIFVNPGKFVRENQQQLQNFFVFETGPDTDAPKITHTPQPFILESSDEFVIEAKITDNLGIESAIVEYYKNSSLIGTAPMELTTPEEDSVYAVTIDVTGLTLANGDQIRYRIIATDIAVVGNPNGNVSNSPSPSQLHSVNVVGLEPTEDFYVNDFNSASDDFFGTGFSISTPAGFNNPAIHSTHPYPEGNGHPGDELNLVYQLKVPIRVKAQEATVQFDEIVLVEPGEPGSVFGDADFFDYVVVEGSKDGGITWIPVADGYDARSNTAWLSRYNSSLVGGNSAANGDPALFRSRTMNLLNEFDEGDEVVIRFRLFSDPFAAGWGWCIDNLKIQIDDIPPQVLNNHVDYLLEGATSLTVETKVNDGSGIESLKVEFKINDGALNEVPFDIGAPASSYSLTISLEDEVPFSLGDVIEYRIVAEDGEGNEGTFPPSGFIKVPVIEFEQAVTQYSTNFNTASNDFAGNFFSITQPAGFENGAVHSAHPYITGMGFNNTSDFSYTLKKPITIAEENSVIRFDEIALVEGQSGSIVFGTPAFNDYVIVEGSKDGGNTWNRFLDGYDIIKQSGWITAFNNQQNGSASLYRTRSVDMTDNANFVPGDEVIIRFRLFSNAAINGWGWAIDNLYIQDAITGTEKELESATQVYPNPTKGNIVVEAEGLNSINFTVQLTNGQGQLIYAEQVSAADGKMSHIIPSGNFPPGLYILKISNGGKTITKKVMKAE